MSRDTSLLSNRRNVNISCTMVSTTIVRSSTPPARYVFPLPHSFDSFVLFTRHSRRGTLSPPSALIPSRPFAIGMADIQDEYTLFSHKYANGVHGYVLVYSINSRQSFDMIQTIYDKILDYSGMGSMPMVIVGQKADLSGERYVPTAFRFFLK
jgi:GTPase SAR1 family protein